MPWIIAGISIVVLVFLVIFIRRKKEKRELEDYRYKHPNIHKLENLLGVVENKESLTEFIKHCKLGIYSGHRISQIRKAAEYRLKKC